MAITDLLADCVQWMDDVEIVALLSNESTGVLGVPTSGAPILRPVSFQYERPGRLHFAFVGSADSRMQRACHRADVARFLVFRSTSPYYWRSLICTGPIRAVCDGEQVDGCDRMSVTDRPAVIERAAARTDVSRYELVIETSSGLKSTECPPGFEPLASDSDE